MEPEPETASAAMERDARDLRRGMSINLIGYAIKFLVPFLTIVVIRVYGAGPYGVLTVVQAILGVMLRMSLLGLDKGLLWWIPRQSQADERVGLRPVLVLTTITSALLALATALFLAPVIAAWAEKPHITDSLRWMAAGLVPMALVEVLCQASVAKRRLEAQVLAKEGVVYLTMVVAALLFYALGFGASGLALAFFVSNTAGLIAVLWVFRRAFAGSRGLPVAPRIPRQLWRYAWPMWLSELAYALLQRLDVLLLAALTNDVAVGIFAGAAQYAQNVTAIRVSFDPMMVAMVSQIHHANDPGRLRRGFAHAWQLVATLQLPLMAFMIAAAAWIMPLLGEKYAAGVKPALVLIGLYSVHGLFALNQHIISGYGHSRLVLVNILVAILVGTGLLYGFIPPLGVEGAAWGIGLMYVFLNAVWAVEARFIVGGWHYERSIARMLGLAAVAAAGMAVVWGGLGWWLVGGVAMDLAARLAGLAAFGAVFGLGLRALRRRGLLADTAEASR